MQLCEWCKTEYNKPRNARFCSRRCSGSSGVSTHPFLGGWNKGKPHSDQTKRKISQRAFGRIVSPETRRKISAANLHRVATDATRLKLSRALKGRIFSEQHRQNISAALSGRKGHPTSQETKQRLHLANSGKPHPKGPLSPAWRGGISKHPQYMSFMNQRRRIRKLENGGSHTLEEWLALKTLYNRTCPACLKSEPTVHLSEDHIVPIKHGGSDNISNIQPLCRPCNSRKHTKTIKYEQHARNIA